MICKHRGLWPREFLVDRRQFIKITGIALGAGPLMTAGAGCAPVVAPDPGPGWARYARVGGTGYYAGTTKESLEENLDQLVKAGVSVLEGDSRMSDYMVDAALDQVIAQVQWVTEVAHERNLKVIWYYPSLEVITANGEDPKTRTMARDHSDWLQVSIGGKPNVFLGKQGGEHWVDPTAESAWMCHLSPYREYFFERVRRLIKAGVDAIWVDVPLYMNTIVDWCCTSPYCNARFKADTGMTAPRQKEPAWSDPVWRRWIYWRHEQLARFCEDILSEAKKVEPKIVIVIETFGGDFSSANIMGLDGSFIAPQPQLFRVWEVDSVSNTFAMRPASHDDWACKIRMYKFCRACDRGAPTWAFAYGYKELDATLVMGFNVATQCAPYETQTPKMTSTVGWDFRARAFNWIRERKELLFDSLPEVEVGIIQSSPSRDYIDQNAAEGQFATIVGKSVEPTWWVDYEPYSIYKAIYLADYTGACQLLSHLHVPFVILPIQLLKAADLGALKLVICPSLQCISAAQASVLTEFVERGGQLLFHGAKPGLWDEHGNDLNPGRLDALLGFSVADPLKVPAQSELKVKQGKVTFVKEALGRSYLVDKKDAARVALESLLKQATDRMIETDADKYVHLELLRHGKQLLLHAVNYKGAKSPNTDRTENYPFDHAYAIVPQDYSVTMRLPAAESAVKSVRTASFEKDFTPAELPFTVAGGRVSFKMRVAQYTLVVIDL
jgi:hypothetical protein